MKRSVPILVVGLTAFAFLALASCGPGEFGAGEDDNINADDISAPQYADPEPDDADADRGTFAVGLKAGDKIHVCRVTSGLNHRSGPSTGYRVLRVLRPNASGTVSRASGRWARFTTSRGVGWGHRNYLCKDSASGGVNNGGGNSGGGNSGGGNSGGGSGTCRGFIHPGAGYRVTSNFGACRSGCSRRHAGTDFGLPSGTSVKASDGGTVSFAGWRSGYGNTVEINHCGRYTTRYAHLSKFLVRVGQRVSRGSVIARSGATGIGTGPHLHFEIRRGGPWGTALNPRNHISF